MARFTVVLPTTIPVERSYTTAEYRFDWLYEYTEMHNRYPIPVRLWLDGN